jgi:septal ring-binding cell division protein DamX
MSVTAPSGNLTLHMAQPGRMPHRAASLRYHAMRLLQIPLLVVLSLVASFAAGASLVDEGRAAFSAGDYATAIARWQALIRQGRPEGSFFLGVMYAEGKGVARNHAMASELYTNAAQKNYPPAQYNLGNQYAMGEGVNQDFSKAEYWWKMAAESGLVQAQINLGSLYLHGVTGAKNLPLAKKWLTLAADQGSEHAKELLGKLDAATPAEAPPTVAAAQPAAPAATPAPDAPAAQPSEPADIATTTATAETPTHHAAVTAVTAQAAPSAATPSTTADAAPTEPPVQPTVAPPTGAPAATAAPAPPDTLHREAWVLAQPANHFTIQVLAASGDTIARDFIEQNDIAAQAAYIEGAAKGSTVFRIIYGNYGSRDEADKALTAMPPAMRENSPWVRTFGDMHKLVDRRYADRGAP